MGAQHSGNEWTRRRAGGPAPLFILSFRHRDELMKLAEAAHWQAIAARRGSNIEARFLSSGASVALIDARGAAQEALEAARAVGEAVETNASALLVLVSGEDAGLLDRFHAHGATHFLVEPFSDAEFVQALQFAHRHAERVGGRRPLRRGEPEGRKGKPGAASWRWRPGTQTVELSPALARKAGLGGRGDAQRGL